MAQPGQCGDLGRAQVGEPPDAPRATLRGRAQRLHHPVIGHPELHHLVAPLLPGPGGQPQTGLRGDKNPAAVFRDKDLRKSGDIQQGLDLEAGLAGDCDYGRPVIPQPLKGGQGRLVGIGMVVEQGAV